MTKAVWSVPPPGSQSRPMLPTLARIPRRACTHSDTSVDLGKGGVGVLAQGRAPGLPVPRRDSGQPGPPPAARTSAQQATGDRYPTTGTQDRSRLLPSLGLQGSLVAPPWPQVQFVPSLPPLAFSPVASSSALLLTFSPSLSFSLSSVAFLRISDQRGSYFARILQ